MNEHDKTAKAAKIVEAMTGFYVHLGIYLAVMVLLLAINRTVTPEVWWVQWPFLGWGLGVAAHGLAVFGTMPDAITRWQLRKIKQIKDRM